MSDPVFLITGASSGIGAATARLAAAAGYRVVLAARSTDTLAELATELGGADHALAVECDVTEWEQQQAMVQAALDRFGRLDVVFANAGFGAARGFLNETPELWRSMVLTNVYGAALTIRATMTVLKEARGHLLAHRIGRRPAGAAGLALLVHEVGGDRDGRGRAAGARRHGRARHADRARDRRDAVLRQPGVGARGRRRRADVMWAVSQPAHVDVNEVLVRPTRQST